MNGFLVFLLFFFLLEKQLSCADQSLEVKATEKELLFDKKIISSKPEVYVLTNSDLALKRRIEDARLSASEVILLNQSLIKKEFVTVCLEFTYKNAERVARFLYENKLKYDSFAGKTAPQGKEKTTVLSIVEKILSPTKEFFSEIKTHETILGPVVNESLNRYAQENNLGSKPLYFKIFLEGADRNVYTFLENQITTHEKLYDFCQELMVFIFDMFASFNEKVLIKHQQELLKMQKASVGK